MVRSGWRTREAWADLSCDERPQPRTENTNANYHCGCRGEKNSAGGDVLGSTDTLIALCRDAIRKRFERGVYGFRREDESHRKRESTPLAGGHAKGEPQ